MFNCEIIQMQNNKITEINNNIKYSNTKASELLEIEENILLNLKFQKDILSESKSKINYTNINIIESDNILKRMTKRLWRI